MSTRAVMPLLMISALLVLSGCATKSVHCDAKLTPINAPAPAPLPIGTVPEPAR